jgi:mono/diheme cytochrome c family protein
MRFLFALLLTLSTTIMAQDTRDIDAARAKTNYMLNCQGCHMADGSGLPGSVPSMHGFVGSFLAVPGGRDFLVQVPGSSNSPLSDAALAELLNWILTTMSSDQLPERFRYYSESEVRQTRRHVLVDVAEVRARLVAKMPKSN